MYRIVDTGTWDDPKVVRLDRDAKLVWVYLLSNRMSHVSGIYYLPDVVLPKHLKVPKKKLPEIWRQLAHTPSSDIRPLALRDDDLEIVFVIKMFERQGKGQNLLISAARHIETLHASPLIGVFLETYPQVEQYLDRVPLCAPWKNPFDTPSDTPSGPPSGPPTSTGTGSGAGSGAGSEGWVLPRELDHPLLRVRIEEWLAFRKTKRKSLTDQQVQRQIERQMVGWGTIGAIGAIDEALVQGWIGIFDPHKKWIESAEADVQGYDGEWRQWWHKATQAVRALGLTKEEETPYARRMNGGIEACKALIAELEKPE